MTRLIRAVGFGGLLATILLAAQASAYRVDFQTNYAGQALRISDTISMTVLFDTEGARDVMLLGVGITFDTAVLEYRPELSVTPTYLLYTTAKNAYLVPASTCSPVCGLSTVPGLTNQVQLDFLSSKVAQNISVPGTTLGSFGQFGNKSIGTYVFHVKALGDDFAGIAFSFDGATGGILQLGDGRQAPLHLGAPLVLPTPEPSTALLLGLALAGLVVPCRSGASRRRAEAVELRGFEADLHPRLRDE